MIVDHSPMGMTAGSNKSEKDGSPAKVTAFGVVTVVGDSVNKFHFVLLPYFDPASLFHVIRSYLWT